MCIVPIHPSCVTFVDFFEKKMKIHIQCVCYRTRRSAIANCTVKHTSFLLGLGAFRPKLYGNGVIPCQNVDCALIGSWSCARRLQSASAIIWYSVTNVHWRSAQFENAEKWKNKRIMSLSLLLSKWRVASFTGSHSMLNKWQCICQCCR